MPPPPAAGDRAVSTDRSRRSQPAENSEKKRKPKKKRQRGQKAKHVAVIGIGESPRDRQLGKGKVRELDILRKSYQNDKLPRKTRELLSRMKKLNGEAEKGRASAPEGREQERRRDGPASKNFGSSDADGGRQAAEGAGAVHTKSGTDDALRARPAGNGANAKKRMFDGMQLGENFAQFSARLRRESRKMVLDTARKNSHQREKKRAYYARRKERLERKKRRRRGDRSDSEVEDDDGEYESIAHLPAHWQEILRNNGRPISAKRRKRMHRLEQEEDSRVAFGEQAERPPKLTAIPVRRGHK